MWNDFPPGSPQQLALDTQWDINVESWIRQAYVASIPVPGDPTYFYDPSQTPIPQGTAAVQVTWPAWPNRIDFYLSASGGDLAANPYGWSHDQLLQLADTGFAGPNQTLPFPPIPAVWGLQCPAIDWDPQYMTLWKTFGPWGPRGWLDEYCEWSVARDDHGNVLRIDFVCENPEYWYTLWSIDPEAVRAIYESTLNFDVPAARAISVVLDDLYLLDPSSGQPVIDPSTGRPGYNPLNKWNAGPISIRGGGQSSGGAMHLTATPNTLQTELGLASTATVQRQIDNTQTQALICCSQYGQIFRNSDPHIGQSVNQAVSAGPNLVCLANPVGLYIQVPDMTNWIWRDGADVPDGAQPSDCWQIVRGNLKLTDPVTNQPFPGEDYINGDGVGNFVLHAVMQIPKAWLEAGNSVTLSDILVDTVPLKWAGQVANHTKVGLYARPLPAGTTPKQYPCQGLPPLQPPPPPTSPPSQTANQLLYANLWNVYYNTSEPTPQPAQQTLASNTVIIAVRARQGSSSTMVVTASPPWSQQPYPQIQFSIDGTNVDASVIATVTNAESVTYAVPGNSYPSENTAFTIDVEISPDAAPGMRWMSIAYSGQSPNFAMPSLLLVLAPEAPNA